MSNFIFLCPHCSGEFEAQEDWCGMEAECPNCNNSVTINKPSRPILSPVVSKKTEESSKFTFICPECNAEKEMDTEAIGTTIECEGCCEEVKVLVPEFKNCPHCKQEVKVKAEVCLHCKKNIQSTIKTTSANKDVINKIKNIKIHKSIASKKIIIAIITLMVLCIGGTLFYKSHNSLEGNYKNFFKTYKIYGTNGAIDFLKQKYPEHMQQWKDDAHKGIPQAQFILGNCYIMGIGVEDNNTKGVELFKKAADQGNSFAQYNLGLFYQAGAGVTKNTTLAVKWYKMSAEQENPLGQFRLGMCYEKGVGVTKNPKLAAQWYKMAAEQGLLLAQVSLAACYYGGNGLTKNNVLAKKWFQKAADGGLKGAKEILAVLKQQMEEVKKQSPLEDDYKNFLEKCKLTDWKYATAFLKQKYPEHMQQWKDDAHKGIPQAQVLLGKCYLSGIGVEENNTKAERLFRKAATQGNALAQYLLGYCYAFEYGVTKDLILAKKWYKMSAEQGFVLAQFYLGNFYYSGWGGAKDYELSVKWYRKAAEQGHLVAQLFLGKRYFQGEGISKDNNKAVYWFQKSADGGNEEAKKGLIMLRTLLREAAKGNKKAIKILNKYKSKE